MDTLQDFIDFINYILNKEQTGNTLTPSKANLIIPAAQIDYYKQLVKDYERTLTISDSLSRFIQTYTPTIDNLGDVTLPDDYNRISSWSIGGRPGTMLTEKEMSDVMIDGLLRPSTDYPALVIRGSKIHIEPFRSGSMILNYLRYPTIPVYDCYVDANYKITYRPQNESAKTIINASSKSNVFDANISGITVENTDNYRLYFNIIYSTDTLKYTLNLYRDYEKTFLVGHIDSATNYIASGTIQPDNNSGITGTIGFSCTKYQTSSNSSFNVQSCSGQSAYNTNDGTVYLNLTKTINYNSNGNPVNTTYSILAYSDEDMTALMAYGETNSISSYVNVASKNDSGLNITMLSSLYPATGTITWDLDMDTNENNVIIVLPASKTVELDNWRYEDKLAIAGHTLEMIGINLKDDLIIKYSQKFSQRSI